VPTQGVSPVIQLFPTCLVNELNPEAGMAVVRVLERLGFDVRVPEGLTCCGQPPFNAGSQAEARQIAAHALDVLAATEGPIVVPSGSCGDMLVHQYVELFRDDPRYAERARAVSARCREFSQFILENHPSCHLLRGLGVREQPRALVAAIEGAGSVPFAGRTRILAGDNGGESSAASAAARA
jgi:L-lactate dehydrogenase complex protein LldE